jgi:ligand-binding sensor domain-containing protein/signal transduction histidine kinase/CheY-like chemotaxis protein
MNKEGHKTPMLTLCAVAVLFSMARWGEPVLALDPRKAITQYVHDVWQTKDGLPQSSITAIIQTRDGYLWLGTFGGLVRFDGMQFTVFDTSNTQALRSKRILALFEDRDGALWVGTENGGLSRFDQNRVTTYTTRDGLPNDSVFSICQDREGTLWIATWDGLARLKDGTVQPYSTSEHNFRGRVSFVITDRHGSVWVGHGRQVMRLSDGTWTTQMVIDPPEGWMNSVYADREGNLWIGTWGNGLYRRTRGGWTVYGTREGLSHNRVTALVEDRDGNLWIGTEGGGLNRLKDGRLSSFTDKDGLPSRVVRALLEDREGSLWIGTEGGGLSRLKDGRLTSFTDKDGLVGSSLVPIYQDRAGALWIGAACGGLSRFQISDVGVQTDRLRTPPAALGAPTVVTTYTVQQGLPNNCVWALTGDREGNLWIGTHGGGLTRFKEGRFTSYTRADGLADSIVFSIYEDRSGTLWIGTNSGLTRFKDGRFITYRTADGLVNDSVRFITEDRSGALWIGTLGGLSRLQDGKFTNVARDGLSHDHVRTIYEDRDGILWIGTYGGGLNRLKDGRFVHYTRKDGLYDDVVSQILEDDRGNFWMSGNRGIFRVRRDELNEFAEGRIKSVTSMAYGTTDGMKSHECNGGGQPAGCKTRDGRLWFPTTKGVVVIDPNDQKTNPLPPPVVIEQVRINRQPVGLSRAVEIPPGRGDLEFYYTGLSFLAPEKVRFRYRLDGFDKEWIDAGARRVAYYTNIPPGRYRFRVIARNNDGVWNETGAALEFSVRPFFYQTGVFYALSAVAVVLAAWGFYRLRVRHLKARERGLARLVQERRQAEEALQESNRRLEQALGELRRAQEHVIQQERLHALGQMASGIAHDFNNALAAILGYSELLLMRPANLSNPGKVMEDLRAINTAAKDAANVVRRLREFYRHREEGEIFLPVDLHQLIGQAISLAQPKWKDQTQASGLAISVKTNLQPVPPVPGNEADLREALINLIFNAVDALPGGGTIIISARAEGEQVVVEVSDTGTGMTEDVRQRCLEPFFTTKGERGTGLGLAMVYGVIQRHKGEIAVESEPGKGTTIIIRLPIYAALPAADEKQPVAAPTRSLHILVVEDEPQVRQIMIHYLSGDGHTVEAAANGREGLDKFRAGRFDLVVTDQAMPEMSGDQMVAAIKHLAPRMPIILLTGFGDFIDAAGERPAGVNIIVSKPVTLSALRQAVAKVTAPEL